MSLKVVHGQFDRISQGSTAPRTVQSTGTSPAAPQNPALQTQLAQSATTQQAIVNSEAATVSLRSVRPSSSGKREEIREFDKAKQVTEEVVTKLKEGDDGKVDSHGNLSSANAKQYFSH